MYILVSDFFQKNIIYMYLILEICIVREEFFAFNHVTMFFQNKSDDYLYIQYTYLYIRNLENLIAFKTGFQFVFVLACREY